MAAMDTMPSCSHCQLPVGRLGRQRDIHGEGHWFCCYGCCLAFQVHHGSREEPEAAAWLIRLGVGAFLAMNIMLLSLLLYAGAFSGDDAWLRDPVHWLLWILATPMLFVLGGPFFDGAWGALRQRRVSTDLLVGIGVLAAYGYSAWQVLRGSSLVYFDTASMVLLLFTLGRYLEAQGRARAARCLAPMLAAERAEVRVVRDRGETSLALRDVRAGDLARVLPGERVPVDGRIEDGRSECDESVLSGQPEPVPKAPGDGVHAGSLNGSGQLLVRATADGLQTRWVHIGRLVREAAASRSLVGDSVDRAAAAFVPGVLLLAAATAWFWGSRDGVEQALLAGLAVLVVACPCSLGLAAPLAGALAIGQAAQRGILIRGGGVLERLTRLAGLAFDKTGTLTDATLRPVSLRVDGTDAAQVLRCAGMLAMGSDHPVARAVVELARRDMPGLGVAGDIEARPGAGVLGTIDGVPCAIGSAAFMDRRGWALPASLRGADDEGTSVFVGWQGRVHGRIGVSAAPLPEADRGAGCIAATRPRDVAAQRRSPACRGPARGDAGHRGLARRTAARGQGAAAARVDGAARADRHGRRRSQRRAGAGVGVRRHRRRRRHRSGEGERRRGAAARGPRQPAVAAARGRRGTALGARQHGLGLRLQRRRADACRQRHAASRGCGGADGRIEPAGGGAIMACAARCRRGARRSAAVATPLPAPALGR